MTVDDELSILAEIIDDQREEIAQLRSALEEIASARFCANEWARRRAREALK